jgi:phosphomannomutase
LKGSAPLMVSISGVRGIAGKSLTREVVLNWARAFGSRTAPGPVVVGNDSRPSRMMVRTAVFDGLMGMGCRTIDLGIVPTPTIAMAVRHHRARGGIAITASHNPAHWNALKFFGADGLFLGVTEGQALKELAETRAFKSGTSSGAGTLEQDNDAAQRHIEAVLAIDLLQLDRLRARRFRVALDTVHGAGGPLLKELLDRLGCEVICFHVEPTGNFPRDPEPTAENLRVLGREVAQTGVDIGFVVDPDADRLAVLLENGQAAGEELTLVAAADVVLRHRPGPVVTNVSTTRALDDVATRYGYRTVRTKVGEAHVASKMVEIGAEIGGEGNGGVMFAPVHCVRDSGVGVALILQALLDSGGSASRFFATLPRYEFVKERVELTDLALANKRLEQLPDKVTFGTPNRLDGFKWDFEDAWVQARASNTEPIIRVFAEARRRERAEELVYEVVRHLRAAS